MELIEEAAVKGASHTDEGVVGVNKVDRVRNEVIKERLGQEGILDLVKRRQEK